jgi:hypothetical protein
MRATGHRSCNYVGPRSSAIVSGNAQASKITKPGAANLVMMHEGSKPGPAPSGQAFRLHWSREKGDTNSAQDERAEAALSGPLVVVFPTTIVENLSLLSAGMPRLRKSRRLGQPAWYWCTQEPVNEPARSVDGPPADFTSKKGMKVSPIYRWA